MTVKEAVRAILDKWNSGEYKYGVPEPDPFMGNLERAYQSEKAPNRVVVVINKHGEPEKVLADRPTEVIVIIRDENWSCHDSIFGLLQDQPIDQLFGIPTPDTNEVDYYRAYPEAPETW